MIDDPRAITYIGNTDFRNSNVQFGIRAKDRLRHMYIIGSTGVGKSFLIENMVIQDIQSGNGIALLDPHGGTAEKMLKYVPEHRINDVIYFAPHDLDYPVGFNPLEDPGPDFRSQVSDGLLTAFKRIWVDAFSARMEYVLSNTLLALLEYPGATLLSVNRMLADKKFREKVVANVRDPSVRSVWVDEFMKWEDKFAREAFSAIQNKVGQFTANPMIRNILGQPKSTLDFREMMDTRKIFIANLSKGRVGEQNAPLIGAMLITKIYLASMSRADKSEYEMNYLPPFYLYVDEFQNFANDSFENILSESRKYKLGLIVAHQYITQMPETIQNAVFGNVGTKIVFRTQKPEDAEVFEKVFTPVFTQSDIMNLGLAQIYLTLLIDGVGSAPFSAKTIRQSPPPIVTFEHESIAASRARYTRPRAEVEAEIAQWFLAGSQSVNTSGNQQVQQQSPQQYRSQQPLSSSQQWNVQQVQGNSNNSAHYNGNQNQDMGQVQMDENRAAKKDAEHAAYLEQKRKEIEDRGGVWLSPDEYKTAKENGTLDEVMRIKRAELMERKRKEQDSIVKMQTPSQSTFAPNGSVPVQRTTPHQNNQPRRDGRGDMRRDNYINQQNRREDTVISKTIEKVSAPERVNRSGEYNNHNRFQKDESRLTAQPVEMPIIRKNEARDDTRDSLKAMLAGIKQESLEVVKDSPQNTVQHPPMRQTTVEPEALTKNTVGSSIDRMGSNDSETRPATKNTTENHELTSEDSSAIYTHADIGPSSTSVTQQSSGVNPVGTPLQTPNHIPGWNEISTADLARALGTKL